MKIGWSKKTGTYDLFEAIATKQKTLVVIGGAEHLIFEASQFKDDITTGVTGWLKAHGARCEYVPEEPKGKTTGSTKARE
jgi:alpha-beta hydrolase superfamily lysophospholipase